MEALTPEKTTSGRGTFWIRIIDNHSHYTTNINLLVNQNGEEIEKNVISYDSAHETKKEDLYAHAKITIDFDDMASNISTQ